MQKIYIYFYVIYLVFGLWACTTDEKTEKNKGALVISVSTEQFDTKIKYSELLDSAKFIPLETKDSSQILVEINKVLIDADKVFVLDKFRFKGVMVFDTTGRFLFSLKAGGGAEGEFQHLSDFSLNKKEKQLIVYSTPKLLYYTYEGKYLKNQNLDFLGVNFEQGEDFKAFVGQEYGLIVTDVGGRIKQKRFDRRKTYPLLFLQPMQIVDNGILFRHSLNDTIYLVKKNDVSYHTIIDFQDKRMTDDQVENMINNNARGIPEGKMGRIKNFLDTKNIIYFTFEYNRMLYAAFFNKRTNTTKILRGDSKDQNDVTLEETLPYIVGEHEDKLIGVIPAERPPIDVKKVPLNRFTLNLIESFEYENKRITTKNTAYNPNLVLLKLKEEY